jgi:hypothetical protein
MHVAVRTPSTKQSNRQSRATSFIFEGSCEDEIKDGACLPLGFKTLPGIARLSAMAKIKVMQISYGQTKQDPWPVGQVTVDYGDNALITIPLPTHRLPGDDKTSQTQQCCEAIERLAKALLEFVDQNRSKGFNAD